MLHTSPVMRRLKMAAVRLNSKSRYIYLKPRLNVTLFDPGWHEKHCGSFKHKMSLHHDGSFHDDLLSNEEKQHD